MDVELTENCADAKCDPTIIAALSVIEPYLVDGSIDFSTLQEREFMPYWKYFVITEVFEEQNTFKYILVGTDIVSMYGRDFTNEFCPDDLESPLYQFQRRNRFSIVNSKTILYACGKSFTDTDRWLDWKIVYVPLTKDGRDNFCLNVHIHTRRFH